MPFLRSIRSKRSLRTDRGAIDYLDQYAPYVLVALLPEDAALNESYSHITDIWRTKLIGFL